MSPAPACPSTRSAERSRSAPVRGLRWCRWRPGWGAADRRRASRPATAGTPRRRAALCRGLRGIGRRSWSPRLDRDPRSRWYFVWNHRAGPIADLDAVDDDRHAVRHRDRARVVDRHALEDLTHLLVGNIDRNRADVTGSALRDGCTFHGGTVGGVANDVTSDRLPA